MCVCVVVLVEQSVVVVVVVVSNLALSCMHLFFLPPPPPPIFSLILAGALFSFLPYMVYGRLSPTYGRESSLVLIRRGTTTDTPFRDALKASSSSSPFWLGYAFCGGRAAIPVALTYSQHE